MMMQALEPAATDPEPRPATEEEGQPEPSMEELLQSETFSSAPIMRGRVYRGVITTVGDQGIWVNLGSKVDGLIPAEELENLSEEERAKLVEGAEVSVFVEKMDANGTPQLSYRQALEQEDWERAREYMESGRLYRATIESYNKGGVVVRFGRLRGFIPVSHILRAHRVMWGSVTPSPAWKNAVGDEIVTKIVEVEPNRRRLILSERAAAREAREILKNKILERVKVGDIIEGRVTRLTNFGAFVDLGGADGLVHLSEISWEHIRHPSDVLEEGQKVKVKVIEVNPERRRIGLSIRQLQEDPWKVKAEKLRVGQLVRGTITRLEKYGAFARLENGLEGLIHISEISHRRIEHPKEVLKEGEEVTLRIIRIEPERRRIGLSVKKVDSLAYADLDLQMALEEAEAELAAARAEAEAEAAAQEVESAVESTVSEASAEAEVAAADQETTPAAEEAEVQAAVETAVQEAEAESTDDGEPPAA